MDRDGTNRLLQKLPHIKYLTSKNSGHTLYMDNPAEFAKCVREAVVAERAGVVAQHAAAAAASGATLTFSKARRIQCFFEGNLSNVM